MIIRPATREDIDESIALLHGKMSRKIAPERWRRIFEYDWNMPKPNFGYVAEVDNRIVGYVGAIHSERRVGGNRVGVTNMCAWYLEKEHRGHGAGQRLMAEATSDPARHYTSMTSTSNPRTMGVLRSAGFRSLDDYRWDWQRSSAGTSAIEAITDVDSLLPRLREEERGYLHDLLPYGVQPVLLRHAEAESFAIFSVTQKGEDQPWWDVLYARDTELGFFARFGQDIADALLPADNAVLSADGRFCGGTPSSATRITLPAPRFAKSTSLSGSALDHLYTELQLLSLKLD
ncbi:MAG: N-acetyltransferase family protein [Paracoccaceae bacterium]